MSVCGGCKAPVNITDLSLSDWAGGRPQTEPHGPGDERGRLQPGQGGGERIQEEPVQGGEENVIQGKGKVVPCFETSKI